MDTWTTATSNRRMDTWTSVEIKKQEVNVRVPGREEDDKKYKCFTWVASIR